MDHDKNQANTTYISILNRTQAKETSNNNSTNEAITPENSYIVEIYTFPFIFLIGTVCNFFVFVVMRRKKMRNQSTYFYMAILAIADELVLIVGCLNFWIYLSTEINITALSNITCKLASAGLYATLHFSVWVVIIMTIERFIAVAFPLQACSICTVRRAKLATFTLACIIFLINSHFFFTHTLIDGGCQPKEAYNLFMLNIWPWIDASIYSFIPLCLLFAFNILIVHNLFKASRNISKMNSNVNNLKANHTTYGSSLANRSNSEYQIQELKNKRNRSRPAFRSLFGSLFSKNNVDCNETENKKFKLFKFKSQKTFENEAAAAQELNRSNGDREKEVAENTLKPPDNLNAKSRKSLTGSSNYLSVASSNVQISSNNGGSSTSSANRRLTIMLLVVSFTFCCTSTPIVTLQTVEQAKLIKISETVHIIRGIFLMLQYLNHSINFFLYAVTGKTFRKEFFSLFEPCKKRYSKKMNMNNTNNTYMNKKTANSTALSGNSKNLDASSKNNNSRILNQSSISCTEDNKLLINSRRNKISNVKNENNEAKIKTDENEKLLTATANGKNEAKRNETGL